MLMQLQEEKTVWLKLELEPNTNLLFVLEQSRRIRQIVEDCFKSKAGSNYLPEFANKVIRARLL